MKDARCFLQSHAEVKAILNKDVKGMDLYVSRTTKSGMVGLSRPCLMCMEYIKYSCIKNVYYSIDDNTIGWIKVPRVSFDIKKIRSNRRVITCW